MIIFFYSYIFLLFHTSSIDSSNHKNNLYTVLLFPLIFPVNDNGNVKFQIYHGTQTHKYILKKRKKKKTWFYSMSKQSQKFGSFVKIIKVHLFRKQLFSWLCLNYMFVSLNVKHGHENMFQIYFQADTW